MAEKPTNETTQFPGHKSSGTRRLSLEQLASPPSTSDSDILGTGLPEPSQGPLPLLYLGRDKTPFALITDSIEECQVHYDSRLGGRVLCTGPECVLCKSGKEQQTLYVAPVYVVLEKQVQLLSITTSMRPKALLPQIVAVISMHSWDKVVLFVSRHGYDFNVEIKPYSPHEKKDRPVISAFLDEYDAGRIDLSSVFQRYDNDTLAAMPEIARVLELLGHGDTAD